MRKSIAFTFFHLDVKIGFTARHNWTHFRIHNGNKHQWGRERHAEGTWHLVWGKLSIYIENWTLEIHPLCAECNSADIREVSYRDEGLTVCSNCQSIEQGYRYVNLREYELAS